MKFIIIIISLSLVIGGVFSANATILNFDDFAPDCYDYCGSLETYGGLTWSSNFEVMHAYNYSYEYSDGSSGYINGTVSGDYVAFNAWGATVTTNSNSFYFTGVYLTGAWNNGLNINVIGRSNGVKLYDSTVIAGAYSPTWFQFDYSGVDELIFSSFGGTPAGYLLGGNHFAMDNFTFNEVAPVPQSVPVPEPGTILLFGCGLVGFFGLRKKLKI